MTASLRIIEGRGAFLDLRIQTARMEADIRKTLREMAASYRQRVVATLRAPKSGRRYGGRSARAFYRVQRRSVTLFGGKTGSYRAAVRATKATKAYTASAPGQAPAVLTGTLLRSIRTKVPSRGKGFTVRVFANRQTAFYRHFLEFGHGAARKGRKGRTGPAAPRPVWSPLQAEIQRELPRRVLAALDHFTRAP